MSEQASLENLPGFPAERLAGFDVAILTDLLHLHEDRLPRTVVDECASRGDAMVDVLVALTKDGSYWRDDVGEGEWWALLHAVMILGLIPGASAGEALIAFMRRMDDAGDENLQEWLAGCWPTFFANKPASLVQALCAVANDRKLGWFMRADAIDTALAHAERAGREPLDEAIDWVAGLVADETENWDVRLLACSSLLDAAPVQYRPLIEQLLARQSHRERVFDATDVERAYTDADRIPGWRLNEDPWKFYQPEVIAERQARWAAEEAEQDEVPMLAASTYVREQPKVGRNDPCPCGSGKKYKRCCLAADEAAVAGKVS